MKNIYNIIIFIIAILGIAFVAYSSFIIIQEDNSLLNYGDEFSNYSTNNSIKLKDNVSVSDNLNITQGDYNLFIDCDTKWKIKYIIDGNSYQKEGKGPTNISLGIIYSNAKINFYQLDEGSSSLEIYNSKEFVSSIYQAGKKVNLNYNLSVK